MERTLKSSSRAMVLFVAMAATLSIALAVYLTNMYTPDVRINFGQLVTFRPSNAFRALALATPWAATGISLGSVYTNIATGKSAIGFYGLIPLANLFISLGVYKLAKGFKFSGWKEHAKNIAILIPYVIVITMVTRLNHTLIKFAVFTAADAQKFFWSLMGITCVSNIAAVLMGYPMFMGWRYVQDKIENSR